VGISGFHGGQAVNANAKLTACFECHKPLPGAQDFVFSYGRWRGSSRPHGEEPASQREGGASRTMEACALAAILRDAAFGGSSG